jgi:hypothetical protein
LLRSLTPFDRTSAEGHNNSFCRREHTYSLHVLLKCNAIKSGKFESDVSEKSTHLRGQGQNSPQRCVPKLKEDRVLDKKKGKVKLSLYRPWRVARGYAPTFSDIRLMRLSASRAGRFLAAGRFLVLISVRD